MFTNFKNIGVLDVSLKAFQNPLEQWDVNDQKDVLEAAGLSSG